MGTNIQSSTTCKKVVKEKICSILPSDVTPALYNFLFESLEDPTVGTDLCAYSSMFKLLTIFVSNYLFSIFHLIFVFSYYSHKDFIIRRIYIREILQPLYNVKRKIINQKDINIFVFVSVDNFLIIC